MNNKRKREPPQTCLETTANTTKQKTEATFPSTGILPGKEEKRTETRACANDVHCSRCLLNSSSILLTDKDSTDCCGKGLCVQDDDGAPMLLPIKKKQPNKARYSAYRLFSTYEHGHMGEGVRKKLSCCTVVFIRNTYPDPASSYTGFQSV